MAPMWAAAAERPLGSPAALLARPELLRRRGRLIAVQRRRLRALVDCSAELANPLAERTSDFRQAPGAKHDQRDHGDEHEMDRTLDTHGHPG